MAGAGSAACWRHMGLDFQAPFRLGDEAAASRPADVVVEVGRAGVLGPEPTGEVVAELRAGDQRLYTVYRLAGGWVARFHGSCEFRVNAGGTRVECVPGPGCPDDLLAVLLAGTVTALLLTLRGFAVLHSSAVRWKGRTVLFAGPSGTGKTTLAALCCAAGAELVADDVVALAARDGAVASVGLGRELRLRSAAQAVAELFPPPGPPRRWTADGRLAIQPAGAEDEVNDISVVVVSRPDRLSRDVIAHRLAPTPAVAHLLGNSRLPALVPMSLQQLYFEVVADLAAKAPVVEARVPWGPPFSPVLARRLLDELATGVPVAPQVD